MTYYYITTDDKYAFSKEEYETEEEAKNAMNTDLYRYDYRAIIKGETIFEEENY